MKTKMENLFVRKRLLVTETEVRELTAIFAAMPEDSPRTVDIEIEVGKGKNTMAFINICPLVEQRMKAQDDAEKAGE